MSWHVASRSAIPCYRPEQARGPQSFSRQPQQQPAFASQSLSDTSRSTQSIPGRELGLYARAPLAVRDHWYPMRSFRPCTVNPAAELSDSLRSSKGTQSFATAFMKESQLSPRYQTMGSLHAYPRKAEPQTWGAMTSGFFGPAH